MIVRKVICLIVILAARLTTYGQFDIDVTDHGHTCGVGTCNGSVAFFFNSNTNTPISVTHFGGTSTLGATGSSGGWGLSSLCPGVYNFHFEDTLGFTFDTTLSIIEFPDFDAELVISAPNTNTISCDGEASVVAVNGGVEPINIIIFLECVSNVSAMTSSLCPGNYYYAVVKDSAGCKDYTPCISTEFLDTSESEISELKITIQSDLLLINQTYNYLKIYNLSGQIVLESNLPDMSIEISELAVGPYVVSVLRNGEVYTQKIVKI